MTTESQDRAIDRVVRSIQDTIEATIAERAAGSDETEALTAIRTRDALKEAIEQLVEAIR